MNRDKISLEKLYQDMYKDILDKENKTYNNYEKQFVIINDNINNINKNLITRKPLIIIPYLFPPLISPSKS